jgi:hypothetical protein
MCVDFTSAECLCCVNEEKQSSSPLTFISLFDAYDNSIEETENFGLLCVIYEFMDQNTKNNYRTMPSIYVCQDHLPLLRCRLCDEDKKQTLLLPYSSQTGYCKVHNMLQKISKNAWGMQLSCRQCTYMPSTHKINDSRALVGLSCITAINVIERLRCQIQSKCTGQLLQQITDAKYSKQTSAMIKEIQPAPWSYVNIVELQTRKLCCIPCEHTQMSMETTSLQTYTSPLLHGGGLRAWFVQEHKQFAATSTMVLFLEEVKGFVSSLEYIKRCRQTKKRKRGMACETTSLFDLDLKNKTPQIEINLHSPRMGEAIELLSPDENQNLYLLQNKISLLQNDNQRLQRSVEILQAQLSHTSKLHVECMSSIFYSSDGSTTFPLKKPTGMQMTNDLREKTKLLNRQTNQLQKEARVADRALLKFEESQQKHSHVSNLSQKNTENSSTALTFDCAFNTFLPNDGSLSISPVPGSKTLEELFSSVVD